MEGVITSLSPVLHLTRITNAFAAVGNVWFVILWTRASEQEHASAAPELMDRHIVVLLGAGVLVAVGLFAFAMALNDTLDLRRDRALHPDRPLPSGRLSIESAVWLIACMLIAATFGAVVFGQTGVLMCLLTASAILLYDAAGKHIPSVGLVVIGLIYAAHMLIANIHLTFVWPVWLAMTHLLFVGSVTHRLADRRPALSPRIILAAGTGWLFWSAVLLWVGWRRAGAIWPDWVGWQAAIWPVLLFVLFAVVRWKVSSTTSRKCAAEKVQRYGSLWLVLYAASWMLGQGYMRGGLILCGLAGVAFLAMMTLREVYSLLEYPVGFRR